MSWLAELASKAEGVLNNLDEQAGAAFRNHNYNRKKNENANLTNPPKKYPIPRNLKNIGPVVETRRSSNNNAPSRKGSPMVQNQKVQVEVPERLIESMPRKANIKRSRYNLNNCPKTLVGDVRHCDAGADHFGLRRRRYSLPEDLEAIPDEDLVYKLQNMEVENAMLKNEVNVLNNEVSDLYNKYRYMEDELNNSQSKLKSNVDNETMLMQYEELKQKFVELADREVLQKDRTEDLQRENNLLSEKNKDLEERIKQLDEKVTKNQTAQIKLESDLRHAQTRIYELQSNLERSNTECHRLERDWDAYKLRVKSMLHSKDNEIKALQNGVNFSEDTRELMDQIEALKEEREDLSDCLSRLRNEMNSTRLQMDQLEERNNSAERVVTALRDALKEERAARNRADSQCISLNKELKALQLESGQTIASLRAALRDKDNELSNLKESTLRSADTSALNVADYDVQESIDNEKIQFLSHTLVLKQGKIDNLMADNNMLRIQLEKLDSKLKAEAYGRNSHSVVNVEHDYRYRRSNIVQDSTLGKFSVRLGVMMRRNPVFRIFIIFYMLCLHFWVVTVLFTSRPPEDLNIKHSKPTFNI